jgi:hypothetical protein
LIFVLARFSEAWRVSAPAPSHDVSLLGLSLSYPAANVGAIAVTVMAAGGLVMVGAALLSLARELVTDVRFRRALAACSKGGSDGVSTIQDERPRAFCAGLLRPHVYITTGALAVLDERAAKAVVAHERHHARRRDPMRLAFGRALAAGFFPLPALRTLARRQHELSEMSADEAAVQAGGGDRSALAVAMLEFATHGGAGGTGIAPERVDHLLGEPIRWRVPWVACLAAGAALSLFIVAAALAAGRAVGSATLAPPFLSSRPCIVVLAMFPAIAALVMLARLPGARRPVARSARGPES